LDKSSEDLFLHGRVAIVTGGSRGIGRGIAELLAERGAAVGIAYREREELAREFEASVRAAGGRAWAGRCDVADEMNVAKFFEQAVLELGPVDILVNNAGLARDTHIALLGLPQWQQVMHVNLDGVYHCVRAVVRGMLLRRWGRIINVSSPSARMPLRGQSAYAASKAGLEGFTRALSRDLASRGVLVNAVSPGLIDTEMLAAMPDADREASVGPGRPAKWRRWSRFSHQGLPAT
jgi:3-oxoacyl-[acyl-carrier protein] reductase